MSTSPGGPPLLAAAVALADLVPATGSESPGRLVQGVGAGARARTGPLHGMDGGTTLCGLPVTDVAVLRRPFVPGSAEACPRCADALEPPDRTR